MVSFFVRCDFSLVLITKPTGSVNRVMQWVPYVDKLVLISVYESLVSELPKEYV